MQLVSCALLMLAILLLVVYIDALHAIGTSGFITIPPDFQTAAWF